MEVVSHFGSAEAKIPKNAEPTSVELVRKWFVETEQETDPAALKVDYELQKQANVNIKIDHTDGRYSMPTLSESVGLG